MAVRMDHGDGELAEMHDINVTPFIEVMLVLLIIFMVAAPLATVDINVNLPTAAARPQPRPDLPIFVSIKADRSLAIGEAPVTRAALAGAIDKAAKGDKAQSVFLRADKTVDYQTLMDVLGELRNAGYLKLALVGLDGSAGK